MQQLEVLNKKTLGGLIVLKGDDGEEFRNGDYISFTDYKNRDSDAPRGKGKISFSEDLMRFEVEVFSVDCDPFSQTKDSLSISDFFPFGQDLFGEVKTLLPENKKTSLTQIDTVETDKYSLEIYECSCGLHSAYDASYLEQVESISTSCPSCGCAVFVSGDES